ncbi:MAG: acyltransferase [Prevotellaceae bacterium]|nr:acyltransferase [Candidatus Colivivens caballi]
MDAPLTKKPRLEWIDAMRGFTMILVVAMHVATQGFTQEPKYSSSLSLFLLLRMPLFFFISGFLSYKANADWSFRGFSRMVGKKMRIQIIPTVVFFLVFITLIHPSTFGSSLVSSLASPMKAGYWFTLTLLYMFIIYYVFEFFEQKLKYQSCVPILLLWVLSLIFYETCYMPKDFPWAFGAKKGYDGWLNYTSMVQVMIYFHFFIFGNIVHRYWGKVEKLYDKQGFIFAIIVLAFLSSADYISLHLLKGAWANLSQTLARYSLLTLTFLFFRYYQTDFSKDKWLGRGLQYIGTRTLDIYLIHFLLLPRIPEVGEFFNKHPHNFVVDSTLSFIGGIIVIGFCIVISNTLRISPFLKKYLFGRQ